MSDYLRGLEDDFNVQQQESIGGDIANHCNMTSVQLARRLSGIGDGSVFDIMIEMGADKGYSNMTQWQMELVATLASKLHVAEKNRSSNPDLDDL